MPPTTRSMTARGQVAPNEYAVRQKQVRTPPTTITRRFKPYPVSMKTKHDEIGFDRQELQDSGALESRSAASPSLVNDIHELFHKDKFVFDGGPPPAEWNEAYENMKPAFRLVSRWITDPGFGKFWNWLGRGSLKESEWSRAGPNARNLQLLFWEREGDEEGKWVERPDEDAEEVPECFGRYANQHHFRFRPVRSAWAETRSQSVPGATAGGFASVTILHDDFFHLSYTTFRTATTSQQLRFLYFLAINLAHELAHVMWHHREVALSAREYHGSVLAREPFLLETDIVDELGISWEMFMFGGRIQPLNQLLTPFAPDGLVVLGEGPDVLFIDVECKIAPLLTKWISDQFSETWWRKRGRKALARRPGRARRAPVRATVNRTTDSDVFLKGNHETSLDARVVAHYVRGGCQGLRLVQSLDDTYLLTGHVHSLYVQP